MGQKVNVDFIEGRIPEENNREVQDVLEYVKRAQEVLVKWPVDRIIEVINAFGESLLERSNPLHRLFPGYGIPFIASWCRESNLRAVLETSFESRQSLDMFVTSAVRSDRSFKAFPRGMVIHWMAGNVPTLGFLSLIMGILTKNGNIIKVASSSDTFLSSLLVQMSKIGKEDKMSGAELVKSVAVIRYDHQRKDIGKLLSENVDVRIIWGSDESVLSIRELPAKLDTTDVVFPNRTSFIVIGNSAVKKMDLDPLARKAALDVSIFEQKACASPHTIFLVTDDDSTLESFAEALKRAMHAILKTFPKIPPSQKEVSAILNLRAQYDMFHNAWYSSGTEFTILSDDHLQLGPAIGNRTVYLRKLPEIEMLKDIIPENAQTVGIAADPDEFDHLTDLLGTCGLHRFTRIGAMTHFESPWDGYLIPQHLVRWVSRPHPLEPTHS